MAEPKTVKATDRNGVEITATVIDNGKQSGLAIFIPGDFTKPDKLEESESGRMRMIVSTENWLSFKGAVKNWDLVGGIHFGYGKPRKKR